MSNLVNVYNLSKSYAHHPLFSGISFGIEERERIGIVGPNGSGKSTLLKLLVGDQPPDEGTVSLRKGLRVIRVEQQAFFNPDWTVEEVLADVFKSKGLDPEEHRIEIDKTLWRLDFTDTKQKAGNLSGGWKKRLSLACALVQDPEILLLDEPTNHLDLEGILSLENILRSAPFSLVVISHDRYFLENVCNRIIEIDRVYPSGLFSCSGSYSQFLTLKAEFLSGQQEQQSSLANKVRREVEWLRQGAKARTTKQQARIQNAELLQSQLADMNARLRKKDIEIDFQSSQRKTKKLIALDKVSKTLGERTLINKLDLVLTQGTRLGLMGPNASGKSTLLRVLAKEIPVDSGRADHADKLRVVYFEQNRETLNPNLTLKQTLAPDGDSVVFRDRSMHIISWIKKFLFKPEQLDTPISKLSGGEQARVLIAKLMLQAADVLLLDEPTNDLDIPTLEVLEESLNDFEGAIVLITHDRFMLDRVCDRLLSLDGNGKIEAYEDYAQWQAAQKEKKSQDKKASHKTKSSPTSSANTAPKKLTYKEQRELEGMESKIAELETKLHQYQEQTLDPDVIANSQRLQEACKNLSDTQEEIDRLFTRWSELEARN